jgi:hypothetical protein
MRKAIRFAFAMLVALAAAVPSVAGIDDSWDWPDDPATAKPRRKLRIKYGFAADAKLGDAKLKDIMDDAVANWNGAKADTGWEFEVVASDPADVVVESDPGLDTAGGAVTEFGVDPKTGRLSGTAKVKFDPTPPGYGWDEAGKNKDDTKNPVSCAKHELSHLLRLDHQGGIRSVSKKLKDPQGKNTKGDDVTTVSQDDKDEAKKSSTLAIRKPAQEHPAGHDCQLTVPGFAGETPQHFVPPPLWFWAPNGTFGSQTVVSLSRRCFNALPDPFLLNSGRGRLIKGAEIVLQGLTGPPRVNPNFQVCIEIPYCMGNGPGHFMEVGDIDYGPLHQQAIEPLLWDPVLSMWRPLQLYGSLGQFVHNPGTETVQIWLPAFLLNAFILPGDPNTCRLLLAIGAVDDAGGDALFVRPPVIRAGTTGSVLVRRELPAGPGGFAVDVTSGDPLVTPPGRLLIPEGAHEIQGPFGVGVPPGPHRTSMMGTGSGFGVDSFFDIFTEITMDAMPTGGRIGDRVPLMADLSRTSDGAPLPAMPVMFHADGDPAGIAFTNGSGRATFDYVIPERSGAGSRLFVASFLGDDPRYGPGSRMGSLTVEKADTTLYTIDRSGTITGHVILRQFDLKRLSDNALLEGRTISFKIDGTEVGTGATNAGGDSTLDWIITDGPGTRTITTAFAGDAAYNGCSDDATLTCQTHLTKMSGVDREGRITAYRILKAWLWKMDNSPVSGKSIAFKLDGTLLSTDNTRPSGLAQVGYTIADGAGAGTRAIRAEWLGDGGYLPSSCNNTLTVYKATPYIWVMPRSVPRGGLARLYAYFRRLLDYQPQTGKPVDFKVDGTVVHSMPTDGSGVARYNYMTSEPVGAHTIRCEFYGDAWLDPGYGDATLTIY